MASIRARILDVAARNRDRAASVRPAGLGATGNMFLSEAQTLEGIAGLIHAEAVELVRIGATLSQTRSEQLRDIAVRLSGDFL
jgi:hypothetical protein